MDVEVGATVSLIHVEMAAGIKWWRGSLHAPCIRQSSLTTLRHPWSQWTCSRMIPTSTGYIPVIYNSLIVVALLVSFNPILQSIFFRKIRIIDCFEPWSFLYFYMGHLILRFICEVFHSYIHICTSSFC